MKKKLLFVIPSLDAGGAEKSLVNLLGVIDLEQYEVDVVLFNKSGIFLDMLPDAVSVDEIAGTYRIFSQGIIPSVVQLMLRLNFWAALNRIVFAAKNKAYKNKAVGEQQSWKHVSSSIKPLEKKYDAAIGYLEKSSIYFVVDKVNAAKKIGWIHTNYSNSGMDAGFDAPYFAKLDNIVTVSDECAASLESAFPSEKKKISIIHNIVSSEIIFRLAQSGKATELSEGKINIISVGRLSPEKGFALAVETCATLMKKGIDAYWFLIGEGSEMPMLKAKIAELGLQDRFHLIGAKPNPYPYVAKASVYVQPSQYEGKSMAIDEAKILGKPLVVTNFSTVKDQIKDGENGLVSEMNPESLANAIIKITTDEILRKRLVENLKSENLTTEQEVNKLYRLL
ncbi:MAG: glycosyltransferase [Flavobacterium sp.]|nr:MAG: glycosyltransferase [Flavobacterium sp.]